MTRCLARRSDAIDDSLAETICNTLCHRAGNGQLLLAAFAVMPDHWHAVLAPLGENNVSALMDRIDTWVGKHSPATWQEGYHETRIRSGRQFAHVVRYVEMNPVGAGLVRLPEEWAWSSVQEDYRAYLTRPWPWGFEYDD